MTGDDNNDMLKRVAYFYKDKLMVHVSLKGTSQFYNGIITELADPEFFIINDRVKGEMVVFFQELKWVERFTK